MCGRGKLTVPFSVLARLYRLDQVALPGLKMRFNIAPTQPLVAIRQTSEGRRADFLHWGLIPSFSQDRKIAYKTFNARSETAASKPSFRRAFAQQRCIIPLDGFYEWKREGKQKTPYYFGAEGERQLLSVAGLWETWQEPNGDSLLSCSVLTQDAVGSMVGIHTRMPVRLGEEDWARWLSPERIDGDSFAQMIARGNELPLRHWQVGDWVNKAANDGPRCVLPAAEHAEGEPAASQATSRKRKKARENPKQMSLFGGGDTGELGSRPGARWRPVGGSPRWR